MVSWTYVELEDVGSTQAIAKSLASMGATEGTVVVAKSQSFGEGRLGRTWLSPPGGLYMSIVLRPNSLSKPELIPLVSAVAVVKGVEQATGVLGRIRWPNDVMVKTKKLAGVLSEAQSYKGEVTQVVVGIGLNCNAPIAASTDLKESATSLMEELGKQVQVAELKHSVLDAFSELYDELQKGANMMPVWKQHFGTLGKPVSVKLKTGENPFTCKAIEVDSDGGLVVEGEKGNQVVHTGDLEWLKELS